MRFELRWLGLTIGLLPVAVLLIVLSVFITLIVYFIQGGEG